jgi:hypothetical protein
MNEYGALVGAFYEGRNKVNGRNWGSAVWGRRLTAWTISSLTVVLLKIKPSGTLTCLFFIMLHPIVLYYAECKWHVTVKHNALMFDIQCYIPVKSCIWQGHNSNRLSEGLMPVGVLSTGESRGFPGGPR